MSVMQLRAVEGAVSGRMDSGLSAIQSLGEANLKTEVSARLASFQSLRGELHARAQAHEKWIVSTTTATMESIQRGVEDGLRVEISNREAGDTALRGSVEKEAVDREHGDAAQAERAGKDRAEMEALVAALEASTAEQITARGVEVCYDHKGAV